MFCHACPVIVGFGGVNPAGRSSSHHGYRRMVIDELDLGCTGQNLRLTCRAHESYGFDLGGRQKSDA